MKIIANFYLLNSRIATHLVFWMAYYVLFGFLWVGEEGYVASFYLEFILLPPRMLAVYTVLYWLLPKFLLNRKYVRFIIGYGVVLLLTGLLQRVFIHFFYEELLLNDYRWGLLSPRMLVRAMVLINTTVLFVLAVKIFQLWLMEREKNANNRRRILEIKSNRKFHRVPTDTILFVEGLGNYVTYHLSDASKVTSYGSIKNTLSSLPENFVRVHRSYIINKDFITSYGPDTVEIRNRSIPRGKSMAAEPLLG